MKQNSFPKEEEAIRRVAFAFGVTCDEIKWMLSQCFDLQSRKQMFDSMQRQVQILSKGKNKTCHFTHLNLALAILKCNTT